MNKKQIDFMDNVEYEELIEKNKNFITKALDKNNLKDDYDLAIVLGSGMFEIMKNLKIDLVIPFDSMPYMPKTSVKGHESRFVFGQINSRKILVILGRIHAYEGYCLREITMYVRILKKLGIEKLIISNAAGAINSLYKVSELVLIKDYINFSSMNPLIGKNLDFFGERFPSMHDSFDKEWISRLKKDLKQKKININSGVYSYMVGPSYETKAEIKMLKKLGADLVGMSTVFECIVAVHSNIKVLGLSLVTNKCSSRKPVSHEEVLKNAKVNTHINEIIINSAILNA